jgi:uncharacterized peroxidase-related enzyme
MPRFPVHTVENAPEASQAALEATQRKFGTVLNIMGEMAHAPVVLATYAAMTQAIAGHGSFDAATREAIALAVGNQDGCAYCQSAHTLSARQAGLTEQQTVDIRGGNAGFDARLDALLAVARHIAADAGNVPDEAYERARKEGWSEEQLAELFAHVAVNIFTNYFNHYARTELDIPAAPGITT